MVRDKQTTNYDVVIVGAGVLGCALALQLWQQGKKVVLLDAVVPSFAKTNPERVIALSQGSARYLAGLGLWEAMLAHGSAKIERIHVCQAGDRATVDMAAAEIQADALGYVMETRLVLQALQAALQGKVAMLCPARCVAMQQDASGVCLQVKMNDADDKYAQLHSQLLVGADGSNSQVRQLAGIQTSGWDHNRLGLVASLTAEKQHGEVAYECFRQQGPLALLPLADGRFSLVWSLVPQRAVQLMAMDDGGFISALEADMGSEVLQQTGRLTGVSNRGCFPLEFRVANHFSKPGIALIGNAAHTIHPVAGQGMNLGLRDVAVLADVLAEDWAQGKLNSHVLAETYAERRRLDTLAVVGFTEGSLLSFAAKCLPVPWLRGQVFRGLQAMPSLKQLLLQQASGLGQIKG